VLELAGIAGVMARVGVQATPEVYNTVDLQLGRPYILDLLKRLQDQAGAAVTGDKFPPYNRQLPVLQALFPDCKVIHILRDGRDVVASAMYAQATGKGWRKEPILRGVPELARRWADDIAEAFGQAVPFGGRVLHLRYEDLIAHPVDVADRLCAFLDLPISPALRQAAQVARAERSWRTTLSPAEQETFRTTPNVELLLQRLGYPPTPAHPDACDTVEGCLAEAAATQDPRSAAMALLRGLRLSPKEPRLLRALLARSQSPASHQAALIARALPGFESDLGRWSQDQGVPPPLAEALWGLQ
jgi:hypothetical protein